MNTFNKITRGLQKTIAKLERLAMSNFDAVTGHHEAISGLNSQIDARRTEIQSLNQESDRATSVAKKLGDLIGA